MSKLTIKMLSDWHIGSGTGRPRNIDRLIQRDVNNLPYIPAKTLTGILRDGCELVADGLDGGNSGIWHDYLEYLFGNQPPMEPPGTEKQPIPAALSLRSAHLPSSLQGALQGRRELQTALTFVKPGVAIDSNLGTAKPDCLRVEEMVRSGSYLEAEYELNTSGLDRTQTQALKALFLAGSAILERLGGKRRRGAGKCEIKLVEEDLAAAIEYLEKESPPSLPVPQRDVTTRSLQAGEKGNWYAIELYLETRSPLIVHSRTLGNLVSTLDYIPGAALLPIISRQLRETIDVGKAIANRQLIISNATPEVDEQIGRAIPFALFQEKQDRNIIYNRLGESTSNNDRDENRPQLKGMRSGYVGETNYLNGSKAVATHNIVEDSQQRPNEEVGGVYSYQAIPPYTKFRSIIYIQETVISKADAEQQLDRLVNTDTQIGRSKKDDYGLVRINAVNFVNNIDRQIENVPETGELRVWLLSDVLIRNSYLRPSTHPEDLARVLGKKLGDVNLNFKKDSLSSLARSSRTDSWQTRWGLPRPSLVGLSAGSCFLFITDKPIDRNQLAELERTGIGERTAEGYGRLCFNDPLLMHKQPTLTESKSLPTEGAITAPTPEISPELNEYVTPIEKEAWREAIRRTSLSLAASKEQRKNILGIEIDNGKQPPESQPSLSQLGVLRAIVMTEINTNPAENTMVNSWIDGLPDRVRKKWPNDSLDKICQLLTTPDRVWEILNSINFDRLTITQERVQILKQGLWKETVQILIMECLRAHKRESEK